MDLRSFVAGGAAGSAGIALTQPLDTIRIRLQTDQAGLYRGSIAQCARATLRGEGARGLFKGVLSPVLTAGAMNAVLFTSYEAVLGWLQRGGGGSGGGRGAGEASLPPPPLVACCLAGFGSGVASAFITAPTELVKCRAQVDVRSRGRALRDELRIARSLLAAGGGAGGIGRGLGVTVARDSFSFAVYFGVYEALVRAAARAGWGQGEGGGAGGGGGGNPLLPAFVAGGCAGVAAWAVIYPLDLAKTRYQVGEFDSARAALRACAAEAGGGGTGGLFRGLGATVLRAAPQHGVTFVTYELVKGALLGDGDERRAGEQ